MAFMKFIHSRSGFVAFLASILASMTPMIVPTAKSEPATVIVSDDGKSAELPARFLGLSYEASMVLSKDGRYYFDPKDEASSIRSKRSESKAFALGQMPLTIPGSPSRRSPTLICCLRSPGPRGSR